MEHNEEQHLLSCFKALGWNDLIGGISMYPKRDMILGLYGLAYEEGRLTAANVLSAGMEPPPWQIGEPMPQNVFEAVRHSISKVGKPSTPKQVLSPDGRVILA